MCVCVCVCMRMCVRTHTSGSMYIVINTFFKRYHFTTFNETHKEKKCGEHESSQSTCETEVRLVTSPTDLLHIVNISMDT